MPLTFRGFHVEHPKPPIGVMPRRVWEEHRIRALAEAIVRRMGNEEPMVASVFDLSHVRDWAAEIVELCERHDGQGVEILRARVNELEAMVEERGKAVTDAHVANHAMHRDLLFALEIGQAMREAMRHGSWGHDGEGHLASVSAGAWDRFKASLAASVQGTAKASEAPGEGGDSGQGSKRDAKADDEDGGDVAVTIDQLMRRMAVRLRTVREALEHPAGQVSLKDAAVLTDSALKDLHEVAAKLQAVGRDIGEREAKP